ncbi:GNAT family N-acetyltransferase [Anaerosporobacter faecicola]|uniref:GNAT family N-acetyltransferase n=1 Tax=Anaerosporobacter faecicola TaxID=2718714 RepID=UPI00143B1CAE|nr:GNAT family N-acetyltransferase [Anaerosporobacter faecicola]
MHIEIIDEKDLQDIAVAYMEYFNDEGDSWSQEGAYKRLHQMWSIDDSICLKAMKENELMGIGMGYLEWFDDGPYFHIFEILILKKYQNFGIGTLLLKEAERIAKEKGAKVATLEALNDEQHEHFYGKLGYSTNQNLVFKMKKLQ